MTIGDLLKDAAARIAAAGLEDAQREARLLMMEATGLDRATIFMHAERVIDPAAIVRFRELAARRAQREPMSHILGRREFWSLTFKVTAHTLDPRPDSETLVQAVLDQVPDRFAPLRLVDFGTGTGCLLLALLHELPRAEGLGVDASEPALVVARENAAALGLAMRAAFRRSDWDEQVDSAFDILISNPPYIPSGQIDTLQPEVAQYEPRAALDGGTDGLCAYRRLAPAATRLLIPGGLAAFEIGVDQSDSVIEIMAGAGLRHIATAKDLAGIPRCLLLRKP
ncbi:peptide chain release factor N(5)-glutamine methyltransferase [Dongia deserti]|uniref:peptide chain release factor N(5)-glutamine methyltransferase n=1 Tax=Dongia deserti TaxID=2268030 RepID=UPI000E65B28E|nr:peptide chain release factor N(5)-glutamine methyltransferase [Dongia deserti]